MEETISAQGADISRLHRIINHKDKEIHSLKKRLSKYEEPGKDSHNSSVPPLLKNQFRPRLFVVHSLCARSLTVKVVLNRVIRVLPWKHVTSLMS